MVTRRQAVQAAAKTYTYTRGGVRVTSTRPLSVGQLNQALVKAKAKAKPQVAVFDQAGNLVGTCDPDKITAVDAGKAPAPAPSTTPATDDATAQTTDDVAKALQGAKFSGQPVSLVKSAGSVDARYEALTKSLDGPTVRRLADAVAHSAMRFTFGSGIPGAAAARLAKSIALDVARAEVNRPKSSTAAAAAALRAVLR